MDSCQDINGVPAQCTVLTTQTDAAMNACSQKNAIKEQVEGCQWIFRTFFVETLADTWEM